MHFIEHEDEVIFAGDAAGCGTSSWTAGAPDAMDAHASRPLYRTVRGEHPRCRDIRVHARRGTGGGVRNGETTLVERFAVYRTASGSYYVHLERPKDYQKPHVTGIPSIARRP